MTTKHPETTKKSNRGGARAGAGRKKGSTILGTLDDCLKELIIPAVVTAWQAKKTAADPFAGDWIIHLSKTNIRLLYGAEALDLFCSFFLEKKRGGISKDGTPFNTRWEAKMGQYKALTALIELGGHDVKYIQDVKVDFPPVLFLKRLEEREARLAAKQAKKATKKAQANTNLLDNLD